MLYDDPYLREAEAEYERLMSKLTKQQRVMHYYLQKPYQNLAQTQSLLERYAL